MWRRDHEVPGTGSSRAKQGGAARTKRRQKAEEAVRMPWTGTPGAEQAAGAAAPSTGSTGDKWRQDARDWIIRDGTSRRSRPPPDRIIRGQAAAKRPGLDHLGLVKQQDPAHPGLDHPGQNNKERPQPTGLDSGERRPAAPGRIPGGGLSGLERPRESGGQRRTKQEAEAKGGTAMES